MVNKITNCTNLPMEGMRDPCTIFSGLTGYRLNAYTSNENFCSLIAHETGSERMNQARDAVRKQKEKRIIAYLKKVADADLDGLFWVIQRYVFKALNDAERKKEG